MRVSSFIALAAVVSLGLGAAQVANAQSLISGSFGIDAQSNPITTWSFTGFIGGAPPSGTSAYITATTGTIAGSNASPFPMYDRGHNVMHMDFGATPGNNTFQVIATDLVNYWNAQANGTPWIQVSWIDNNTGGTQTAPRLDWFASDTRAGKLGNRVTSGTLFGLGDYTALRYDSGTTKEETIAGDGVKAAAGTYVEHTARIEKLANGTIRLKLDGGAAYGNYEVDDNWFATSGVSNINTGGPGAGSGTDHSWWTYLEPRIRLGEANDQYYLTDLKLGSLAWLKADMNGDNAQDNFDIGPFEQALVNPGNKATSGTFVNAYPLVTDFQERGDINYDHVFDNFDIGPFEAGLTGGFGGGAAVPEPSTVALLAIGGLGLLLSRFRKSFSRKGLKVVAMLLVAVSLFSVAGQAQASRIFLSTTSTNPALINPSLTLALGATANIYVFWAPTTEVIGTDEYGDIVANEQLSGWSHDLVSSNPILTKTAYSILNPSSTRWGSVNTGTGTTFMVDNGNAVKVGGSNLGFSTAAGQGYFNVGGTDVWRMATLTFQGTATGTTSLFNGVGSAGISFQTLPNARGINFGFGDAQTQSNNFGATSSIADATITVVPEPGTLALLGLGVVGLVALAKRRRQLAG